MKRRQIRIRGQNYNTTTERFNHIKGLLKEKFKSEAEIDAFVQHIMNSGWSDEDINSFSKQAGNTQRPAVDVFLFNGEHTLDQMILQQGVYTNMKDTAVDPNYAIRHRGQTELIFRRLTPGDLLMLNATQIHNMRDEGRRPAEEQHNYWQCIWHEFVMSVVPSNDRSKLRWLFEDLNAAAVASIYFAKNSMVYEHSEDHYLFTTFMNEESPYYTGMKAKYETRRGYSGFDRGWYIHWVEDRDESRAMTALVLACYGIDNYARAALDGQRAMNVGDSFSDPYVNYLRSLKGKPIYFTEADNGDKEARSQRPREGFSGLGSIFGGRPRQG